VVPIEALPTTDHALIFERALLSQGRSDEPVYLAVARILAARCRKAHTLIDVGCGRGNLWSATRHLFDRYIGIDVVAYEGFPIDADFLNSNLENYSIPLPGGLADTVVTLETIEHLDNPRAFMRELVRLVKPGGWVVVTTPNQLSLLSKMTLLVKNQFNAFQAASYPAHRTALLEIDLVRMATESGLSEIAIEYTNRGRIPFSSRYWPSYLRGRTFSDNILLVARKPCRANFFEI
jgi:2-polyprenyl-3-methyl-5-hydroxy-6-metoxy-1,4-benzoquinol methylase